MISRLSARYLLLRVENTGPACIVGCFGFGILRSGPMGLKFNPVYRLCGR